MEFISERVSVERHKDRTTVVISARPAPLQHTLLVTWLVAWTLCGAYFIHSLVTTGDAELRRGLLIMLAFWAYFELHVVRTFLWRTRGFELWRVQGGVLTVKQSLWRFGRAHDYFVENIEGFGPLNHDKNSWKWQVNDSFWNRGMERLGFTHTGRKVAMGRGLNDQEAAALLRTMDRTLKESRKAQQATAS